MLAVSNLTIMATMIYIDQENSDVNAALSSKDRAQQSGAGKSLVKSHQGKVHGSASRWKTARKALGNVNKQVMKNAQPLAGDQVPVPSVKQVSGSCVKTDAQQYPEIEKFHPYNPEDFETFDVPEEHKLSHLSLVGVGLIVHVNDAKRFESLSLKPELMEIPALGWESDAAGCLPSFLATLEEIIVEMPPIE
ncbi:securin isoform X1 [Ranitomeya imitator]|uniref:securin isoform X1 n=1 Tax=Ranitomeya imitator TaxID=111125 RepID=UPI0037E901C6